MGTSSKLRRRVTARKPWSIQQASETRIPNRRSQNGLRRTSLRLFSTVQMLFSLALALAMLAAPVLALKGRSHENDRRHMLLAKDEGIIFDRRPAPAPLLFRRDSPSASTERSEKASKTAKTAVRSRSSASDASSTSVESASSPNASPLPKAFDGGLGTNYTQPSCLTFLQDMISNDSFTSCLPFSVLLQVRP